MLQHDKENKQNGNASTNTKPLDHRNGHASKAPHAPEESKSKDINNDMISSMTSLLNQLESSNCLVDVREGLQTFLIYVSNIIKHPLEVKYRKIRVGNANYQVRLGHLKHGQALLECIGYRLDTSANSAATTSTFLVLPSHLYTSSRDLFLMKRIRDLTVYRLEKITTKFKSVPRQHEVPTHQWTSCLHAVEAHTIGRRPTMEDDHILVDNFCNQPHMGFFGLYDGHGGRATVDFVACALALNLEHYLSLPSHRNVRMERALDDVYAVTDKQIHRQQIYQSGATAVTVVLDRKNKYLCVANAGDTRAVLCRKGKAIRLTKDHKADDAEEAAMIRKRGGTVGRQARVNGLLAVTRAFGDHLLKPPITVKPRVKRVAIEREDAFLVIACDGVWDVLSDEEVVHYVHTQVLKKSGRESWEGVTREDLVRGGVLRQICLDIVKNALDRRSADNISCMLIAL